jgi:uncharacterized protein (TIGR04255 family)
MVISCMLPEHDEWTAMKPKRPIALGRSPLVEAIFEIRFVPTAPAVGDLLPGLLYAGLKTEYPDTEPLPIANIPRQIRDQQAELLYHPSYRLKGEHRILQVGDRVLSLNTTEYPGWAHFKQWVEFATKAVKETGLLKQIERFSFKYINVIEASASDQQLSFLDARIEITGATPIERGFRLRVERDDTPFLTIIEIMTHSKAKRRNDQQIVSGLLVTVDTIRAGFGNDYWTNQSTLIEEGHTVVKDVFYNLITESTLKRLDPIW